MPARRTLPKAEAMLLAEFGARLRLARQRRRLAAQQVGDATGITRVSLQRCKRGDAAATMGTCIKVLAAMGLAADVAEVGAT